MIRVCRSIGVQYALEGVAALRLGEAVGLRWRPYDTAKEPFRQLLLATSYNKGREETAHRKRCRSSRSFRLRSANDYSQCSEDCLKVARLYERALSELRAGTTNLVFELSISEEIIHRRSMSTT